MSACGVFLRDKTSADCGSSKHDGSSLELALRICHGTRPMSRNNLTLPKFTQLLVEHDGQRDCETNNPSHGSTFWM